MRREKEGIDNKSGTRPLGMTPDSKRERAQGSGTEPGANIEMEIDTGAYTDIGQRPTWAGIVILFMRNLRTLSSLRNRVYRYYYGGILGQMASMNMQMIARSLLAYRLAGSPAILGIMALAHSLPVLSLSLLGGVIADRLPEKYVLIVGQACSAVVALGVAIALTLGYLSVAHASSWWILVVASLLQGIIMGLMMPSRQSIIAEIVDEEHLMNAVALNGLGMNLLRITAPALAGFFIDAFGFKSIYYTMTGLYLMSVIFIALMPLTKPVTVRGLGVLKDLKSGLRYVRHETTVFFILVFVLFAVVLSMPYMFLMPIFADDILQVGAKGMGILISVSGIGAITGSVVLASLPNRRRGAMLLVSGVVLGLALTGFSFSTSMPLSLFLIAIIGLGHSGRMALANTLLQYYVAPDYRGRVMSIYLMEFGLMSFGVFFASILAERIGVEWSVGGFALILALVYLLALAFVPRIRNLD